MLINFLDKKPYIITTVVTNGKEFKAWPAGKVLTGVGNTKICE
jgi:hypothetical protein